MNWAGFEDEWADCKVAHSVCQGPKWFLWPVERLTWASVLVTTTIK